MSMRNATEHQSGSYDFILKDFSLNPDGSIEDPFWSIEGEVKKQILKVGGNLIENLNIIIENSLSFGEVLFLLSIEQKLNDLLRNAPIAIHIQDIQEDERDKEKPVRFKIQYRTTDPDLFK